MRIGRLGEDHALAHYLRLDYKLVERNARTTNGELALILTRGDMLVVCEVRTRVTGRGNPLESFGPAKARQVRRVTREWLTLRGRSLDARRLCSGVRLDAAAVTVFADGSLKELQVLEGAL